MYWTYYDNGCLVEDMMEFTSKNNSILTKDKIDIMQDIINAYNEDYHRRGY